MLRLTTFLCALVLIPAFAAEKPADKAPAKPIGTWSREIAGHTLAWTFNEDNSFKLKVNLSDGNEAEVEGNYGITKDGTLFAIMTKAKTSIEGGPEKGDLFSFSFKVSGKELTLGDAAGTKINEQARGLVEGTYAKK
ncbi:MAG: hypothetical protein SNJ82_01840 [Gemmataceae bacterium]